MKRPYEEITKVEFDVIVKNTFTHKKFVMQPLGDVLNEYVQPEQFSEQLNHNAECNRDQGRNAFLPALTQDQHQTPQAREDHA